VAARGRKPTHGRYTKAAIAERREVQALIRAIRELVGEPAKEDDCYRPSPVTC
jgi:hypothetical protein